MKWAVTSGLIDRNCFSGLASDVKVPKVRSSDDFDVHPFTREERDLIIAAFNDNRCCNKFVAKDALYSNYAYYVQFLFFTGCRPSEAVALTWGQIKDDKILFNASVVDGVGGKVRKSGLKTQDFRYFPINAQLRAILDSIKPANASPDELVFPAPRGGHIDTGGFCNRVWRVVIEGLGIPYRKPYQTRHTFITLCLENGIDAKDVAKWVGNSPEVIYKHYASAKQDLSVPEL